MTEPCHLHPSPELYIGLMSGTSLDGIDACLIQFKPKVKIVSSHWQAFSKNLKTLLKTLTLSGDNEIEKMAIAEPLLMDEYADAVEQLLKQTKVNPSEIKAIGAHGQTLRHIPVTENSSGYSLQLINASRLAVKTGISVTADFRQKDIALGGQGAPLVPAFHQHLFSSKSENRVIVNIGGISNISYLAADGQHPTGFDTGPGNTLLDNWYQKSHLEHYDKNGDWAKSGQLNNELLMRLLDDEYFKLAAPKSTGTEYFNLFWLDHHLVSFPDIKSEDIQTTLTELTALSITNAIKEVCSNSKVFICGGGIHNGYLIERIEHHLQVKISSTEAFGIHPDDVEAAAFGWLAMRRIEELSGNSTSATGANKKGILGGLYLPN